MRRRSLLAAFALTGIGCAFPEQPRLADSVVAASPDGAPLFDAACAPPDPRIPVLAASLSSRVGGEGYYAREELTCAAAERDELVLRVTRRREALARCLPPGPEKEARIAWHAGLVDALLAGRDPLSWKRRVYVVDVRSPPRSFPFVRRACSGTGFEGAGECVVLLMPAGLADIATLPLGTWFWAAHDDRETVTLSELDWELSAAGTPPRCGSITSPRLPPPAAPEERGGRISRFCKGVLPCF